MAYPGVQQGRHPTAAAGARRRLEGQGERLLRLPQCQLEPPTGRKERLMKKQEAFPFARADESQKNAIVITKEKDEDGFLSLLWVLRARSKEEDRPTLCGLHSDGQGKFAATDGHRLHVAEIPTLTERIPGGIWFYVHADKKKISVLEAPADIPAYPDYETLLDLSDKHVKRGWIDYMDDTQTVCDYWDLTHIKSNIGYLLDICRDAGPFEVFSAEPTNGRITGAPDVLPVVFYQEGSEGTSRKAILMPLKM